MAVHGMKLSDGLRSRIATIAAFGSYTSIAHQRHY